MPPDLSVIVVSFNGPALLRGCLAAIVGQADPDRTEVLVVRNWAPAGNDLPRLDREFPSVRWVDAPAGTTVPAMRRAAIDVSRGPIVALTEDDCEVDRGWCRAVLSAHQTPAVAIGGSVEPGPYGKALDWAVYFHDYGRFMAPIRNAVTSDLPGNNVSYKRASLETLPAGEAFYDVPIHRRWAAEGRLLRSDGTLVVRQMNSWGWRHLTIGPFHHGRGYAAQRVATRSAVWRASAGVLALFLPVLSTARVVRTVTTRHRHVGPMVQALPWIVVYAWAWALGESVGYLAGPGQSLTKWR
jgi:hypothetical protein